MRISLKNIKKIGIGLLSLAVVIIVGVVGVSRSRVNQKVEALIGNSKVYYTDVNTLYEKSLTGSPVSVSNNIYSFTHGRGFAMNTKGTVFYKTEGGVDVVYARTSAGVTTTLSVCPVGVGAITMPYRSDSDKIYFVCGTVYGNGLLKSITEATAGVFTISSVGNINNSSSRTYYGNLYGYGDSTFCAESIAGGGGDQTSVTCVVNIGLPSQRQMDLGVGQSATGNASKVDFDTNGNVLAYSDGQVCRADSQLLTSNCISTAPVKATDAVLTDNGNAYWIGTSGAPGYAPGASILLSGTATPISLGCTIPSQDILRTSTQEVYLGCDGKVLYHLPTDTTSTMRQVSNVSGLSITRFSEDVAHNKVWIGTSAGLGYIDLNTHLYYPVPATSSCTVGSMEVDLDGNLLASCGTAAQYFVNTTTNTAVIVANGGYQTNILNKQKAFSVLPAICSSNAQCSNPTPVCTSGSCTACTSNAQCTGGLACDILTGSCVTPDTTAPIAPVVSAPVNGSILNTTTPTVSGTGEVGATVTVKNGATTVCTAVVSAGGTWSCVVSPALTEGSQTLDVTQADPSGNVSPVTSVNFTVDTAAPSAPALTSVGGDTSPAYVTNDSTPSVVGTAEGGSLVTVKEGATTLCTVTLPALPNPGTYTCTPLTPLTDGAHILVVTATDAAGNTSAPTNATVTIDTTSPIAPVITSPTAGSTTPAMPTVSGTGENGATVTVKDGATTICTAVVSGGVWSCTATSALTDGAHTLSATQTDPAGNVSPSSTVAVTVDGTVPAAPVVLAPTAGAALADSTPTVNGTGENGATVTVKDENGTTLCTGVVSGGVWSCTVSPAMTDGAHTLSVTQADLAGNTSSPAVTVPLTVDTVAPVVPVVLAPTSGAAINATPVVNGTGENGATVTVKDENGTTLCTGVVSGGVWNCTVSPAMTDGAHTLSVTQADLAGNTSSPAVTVPVTVDTVAPLSPAVTSVDGDTTSPFMSDTSTPAVVGTAEAGSTVVINDGGTPVCTVVVPVSGTYTCTLTSALTDGSHILAVIATDPAGNPSGATNIDVTVDTTVPTAPVVTSIDGDVVPGTVVSNDLDPVLGTGEAGALITVKDENGNTLCSVTVPVTGSYTCSPVTLPSGLTQGAHTLSITQTDPVGNVSPATTVAVSFDNVAPAAPVCTATPLTPQSTDTVTVTCTGVEDGATLSIPNAMCTPTPATSTGTVTCTGIASDLGSDPVATVKDPAGNSSTSIVPLTVDVPLAPVVTNPVANGIFNEVISGTGLPGATVVVTGPNGSSCNAMVSASGSWSCALTGGTGIVEGTVGSIVAKQKNAAGNFGPSVTVSPVTYSDGDNIPANVENSGLNNGDANGDGVLDANQSSVAGQLNNVTSKYQALSVESLTAGTVCNINEYAVETSSGLGITNPSNTFAYGLNKFKIVCSNPGATVKVKVYMDRLLNISNKTLKKVLSSSNIITIPTTEYTLEQTTVGTTPVTLMTLTLTDGGAYDIDGVSNGIILDPNGLVDNDLVQTGQNMYAIIALAIMTLLSTVVILKQNRK